MDRTCATCRFAEWARNKAGRINPRQPGKCIYVLPAVPLPVWMQPFRHDAKYHRHIWRDENRPCPTYQPKRPAMDAEKAREHDLKTWPQYFEEIVSGTKTFEFRKNDRGFRVGDVLRLREYSPGPDEYTGREVRRRVTYMLSSDDFTPVTTGLRAGWCVLGLVDDQALLTARREVWEEAAKVAERSVGAGDVLNRIKDTDLLGAWNTGANDMRRSIATAIRARAKEG